MHLPHGTGATLAALGVGIFGFVYDGAGDVLAAAQSGDVNVATGLAALANLGAVGVLGYGAKKLLSGELVARETAASQARAEALAEGNAEVARSLARLQDQADDRERTLREILAAAIARGGHTP